MIEETIAVRTGDGTDSDASSMDLLLCLPERGGPHPAIIFFMDGNGIRTELKQMVRRLAAVGYAVALPDLYHRLAGDPEYAADTEDGASFPMMLKRMRTLTNAAVLHDTEVVLHHLAADPRLRTGPVGALGYCMSGQFILSAVGTFPDRFEAAAIFYGVGMVTALADSPHLLAPNIEAELYIGCAGEDPFVPPEVVDQVTKALAGADCLYELEIYPGRSHGFAFPEREAYHLASAERHWERIFSLFRRTLGR